jgi:pimeloyl-ACP methyl ester carboxylesterase
MKRIILLFLLFAGSSFSQDIQGDWYGDIDLSGMKLDFIIHISRGEDGFRSVLDIPEQKAMGIPMTSTNYDNDVLKIISAELKCDFEGRLLEGSVKGVFSQNGRVFPFAMNKDKREPKPLLRPQEPKTKFNYVIKEVTFENKIDKVTLAGTLTLPKGKGPFPAVILVSGSGPQDRNEEILGHKSFWVIADYLTNNGVVVLRYDDRGFAKSTGDFSTGTTEDFARDAKAGVDYLLNHRKIDKSKVGIIGHSEGGTIAPIVAGKPSNKVGFIILLAGTAIPGTDILLKQQELISVASGESEEEIQSNSAMSISIFQFMQENADSETLKKDLKVYLENYMVENKTKLPGGMSNEKMSQVLADAYATPWMRNFMFYDPKFAFLNVKCPVLALNGSLDLQVPPNENLSTFKLLAERSGNNNVQTIELPGLNHLFQHSETGAPSEYGEIEETIAPEVLLLIKNWIIELP